MNITTQTFVIKIYKTYTKGILLIFNIFEHYLPYIYIIKIYPMKQKSLRKKFQTRIDIGRK
jgi:hypothetical protein